MLFIVFYAHCITYSKKPILQVNIITMSYKVSKKMETEKHFLVSKQSL
jgi:hypothetical protein